jgi:hypothetical protein
MGRLTVVALLVAFAPAAAAPTATPHSGFYGVVTKGPIVPVCRDDMPCDAPAQVTLVFTRAPNVVSRSRSNKEGRYRAPLPPGYYVVRTEPRIGFGAIRPLNVHVRKGHFDRLNFSIDTGIR